MPMTTYKLGRDCVSTLPGVGNQDIVDVTLTVSASQQDVTVFKATPLTHVEYVAGLIDVTIDVTCTAHTAAIGDSGAQAVAGRPAGLYAEVLDVKESVNPKGRAEFTITYGLREP